MNQTTQANSTIFNCLFQPKLKGNLTAVPETAEDNQLFDEIEDYAYGRQSTLLKYMVTFIIGMLFIPQGFAWDFIPLSIVGLIMISLPTMRKVLSAGFFGFLSGMFLSYDKVTTHYTSGSKTVHHDYNFSGKLIVTAISLVLLVAAGYIITPIVLIVYSIQILNTVRKYKIIAPHRLAGNDIKMRFFATWIYGAGLLVFVIILNLILLAFA